MKYALIENGKVSCIREGLPDVVQDGQEFRPVVEGEEYKIYREVAYPAIGDQLDAIWKGLKQMRDDGATLQAETNAMLNAILDVKAEYPK